MRRLISVMMFVVMLVLTGCNHKDLCYMDAKKVRIVVEYDWCDAPDANPKGMCVFFYSLTDDSYYRFDFNNAHGGEVELPAGKYILITYNNDTEVVRFSGNNHFNGHIAFTREGDLLEPLYGNGVTTTATTDMSEPVWITPDALWGCHLEEVDVRASGVTYINTPYEDSPDDNEDCGCNRTMTVETQTITLFPHDMLCHYSYEVRNVENAGDISKISASLSGMASTMNLSDESLVKNYVTLPVPGSVDLSNNKITGAFLTFGHYPDNASEHRMTFFVITTSGGKYRITDNDRFNVTPQVDNAPDRRHVHIIIDGMKIPHSGGDGNGWNPTVDDWGVTNEDIKI